MQYTSAHGTSRTSLKQLIALSAAVLTASALTACSVGPDRISKTTIRASGAVASDLEAEFSGLGDSITDDVDYESIELGIGATIFETGSNIDDAPGRKLSRAELVIGKAEFEDADAIEVSGGGRYFFGSHPTFQPFLSVYAVGTYAEIDDFDLGIQLGLRAGGGIEFALSENFFLDAGIDYTVPLVAAESEEFLGQTIDTEFSGWAVRIGLGFMF